MDQNVSLNMVKIYQLCAIKCTQEKKLNFESFTQNGCYGNQPQPFEVVFYSIDANSSCSFIELCMSLKLSSEWFRSYMLRLIYIFGHVLIVNSRCQWPLLHEKTYKTRYFS